MSTLKSTVVSLLSVLSASGLVVMSVHVHKANADEASSPRVCYSLQDAPRTSHRCWPRYYWWTETGYSNLETFEAAVGSFSEEWITHNPGVHALLFGDQLGVYRRPDIV